MEHTKYGTVPVFTDGMAQPVFPFTDGKDADAYDASSSHILRFCVYVETDYDTDSRGRRDRIKVFVQVPRSAAMGYYQAGTLFEACPYLAGINADVFRHMKEVEDTDPPAPDFSRIRDAGPSVPTGEMSSLEAAAASDPAEWNYQDPGFERGRCFDLETYNYYLIRGFAVVMAGGFGTLGSDGVVNTGSKYERDAFCAVIEWLRGDRTAFTDRYGTTAIRADWSSGRVAMTGKSYAGTLPFAAAVTGIPGLETIIPVAGLADWYSHLNLQGAQRYYPKEMLVSMLSYFCSSRYHDPELTEEQKARMDGFLSRLSVEQAETGFDYGPFWEDRNYIKEAGGLRCSALIVHGLNDDNVTTNQFEKMYRCFKNAGREVKLILHQGGHITPTMASHGYGIRVDGEFYDDIVNRWISHYLCDIDNGVQYMSQVRVQSNLDQNVWEHADSWETESKAVFFCKAEGETIVDTDLEKAGADADHFDEKMCMSSSAMNGRYLTPVLKEDLTIQGGITVSFEAALCSGDPSGGLGAADTGDADKKTEALLYSSDRQDDIKITILLADLSEAAMDVIAATNLGRDDVPVKVEQKGGIPLGGGLPGPDLCSFETVSRPYRVITRACLDMCNPEAGYEAETAASSVELEIDRYHSYTAFMNPTRCTVPAGHRLAVIIGTEDPVNCLFHKEYAVSIRNASLQAEIPIFGTVPQGMEKMQLFPEKETEQSV